jgi:hypothetical protein
MIDKLQTAADELRKYAKKHDEVIAELDGFALIDNVIDEMLNEIERIRGMEAEAEYSEYVNQHKRRLGE